jgi:hypothetical protein
MAVWLLHCVHRLTVAAGSGGTKAGQARRKSLVQVAQHKTDRTTQRIKDIVFNTTPSEKPDHHNFYITALVTFDGEVSHLIFSGGVQVPNSTPDHVRQELGRREGGKLYRQLQLAGFDDATIDAAIVACQQKDAQQVATT